MAIRRGLWRLTLAAWLLGATPIAVFSAFAHHLFSPFDNVCIESEKPVYPECNLDQQAEGESGYEYALRRKVGRLRSRSIQRNPTLQDSSISISSTHFLRFRNRLVCRYLGVLLRRCLDCHGLPKQVLT